MVDGSPKAEGSKTTVPGVDTGNCMERSGRVWDGGRVISNMADVSQDGRFEGDFSQPISGKERPEV